MFVVVGLLGFWIGLQSIMLLLIGAYAEEFLKIGATKNNLKKTDFYSSDILFVSLLVALGFSIVENVFYLGQQALGGDGGLLVLLFGRGIFSSLIHVIATGTIALLLYKFYQKVNLDQLFSISKIWRVMMCMLVGVGLHLGYNLAVNFGQYWVYGVMIVGGYVLLSYVLFLSDRVYQAGD
jgi:RsiW-degrading membrane proteinase PrsW (M82 family)